MCPVSVGFRFIDETNGHGIWSGVRTMVPVLELEECSAYVKSIYLLQDQGEGNMVVIQYCKKMFSDLSSFFCYRCKIFDSVTEVSLCTGCTCSQFFFMFFGSTASSLILLFD